MKKKTKLDYFKPTSDGYRKVPMKKMLINLIVHESDGQPI